MKLLPNDPKTFIEEFKFKFKNINFTPITIKEKDEDFKSFNE